MFDWIGDAIEWVGDTVGGFFGGVASDVATSISSAIWDIMFEWIFDTIYGAIAEMFQWINQTTSDIFTLSWIQAFVNLFGALAWMLFVTGMIVAIFDTAIAYESGQANIKGTCLNVLKGFMAVNLFTVAPIRLYSLCTSLQGTFAQELLSNMVGNVSNSVASSGLQVLIALSSDISLFSLFFIILFGYCTVKVVFANIKRGGILLCQIAVGSLYIFGVPRGYSDGFFSWCKQVIALCLTAFLQTTILYLGLLTYTQHPLLSIGICLSANEVPRIAQMYGLDTSVRVNMMSVSHTVSMGARVVKMVGGK